MKCREVPSACFVNSSVPSWNFSLRVDSEFYWAF